jgi:hypothetical protein
MWKALNGDKAKKVVKEGIEPMNETEACRWSMTTKECDGND